MAISNPQQALPVATESQYDIKREETCVEDIETKPTQRTGHVMTTFHSYSSEHQKAVEKRLLRRIDIHIMPLVVIIYIFSYLDRNSVSWESCCRSELLS